MLNYVNQYGFPVEHFDKAIFNYLNLTVLIFIKGYVSMRAASVGVPEWTVKCLP